MTRVSYGFGLGKHKGGATQVIDPDARIGGELAVDQPWAIEFWLGGWMADALCGFAKGTLNVPLHGDPPTG